MAIFCTSAVFPQNMGCLGRSAYPLKSKIVKCFQSIHGNIKILAFFELFIPYTFNTYVLQDIFCKEFFE